MASTNKTTNYELSQFVETDRPAWLTDYNGDMRTIDSTMKAISDVASGASGSISELADRMSTAEGNISTNTNDIAALDARADALEAGAQSMAGTIAGIQAEQTAQNLGIEAATELGYNLARPYDSASTYSVGDYVLFQNTLYKCVTAIATGEAFDPTKWLAIKATDEIAAGGYTLPIASPSQLGGVKVGGGLSIDPAGVLSASDSAVITELNLTNFDLSGATFTAQKISGGTTTSITLNNPSLSFMSGYQKFLATIKNLNILNVPLQLSFDSYNLASNEMLVVYCNIPLPNILGSFSGMPETRSIFMQTLNEIGMRFNLSVPSNKITITAMYKNTSSSAANVSNMQLLANLIYVTDNI